MRAIRSRSVRTVKPHASVSRTGESITFLIQHFTGFATNITMLRRRLDSIFTCLYVTYVHCGFYALGSLASYPSLLLCRNMAKLDLDMSDVALMYP
jgi:hypothetical protein